MKTIQNAVPGAARDSASALCGVSQSVSKAMLCTDYAPLAPSSLGEHPDVVLIQLGQKFSETVERVKRGTLRLDARNDLKPHSRDMRFEKLCALLDPVEDALIATPAKTLDGLIVKARASQRWGLSPGEINESLAESIVRDLLAILANATDTEPVSAAARAFKHC